MLIYQAVLYQLNQWSLISMSDYTIFKEPLTVEAIGVRFEGIISRLESCLKPPTLKERIEHGMRKLKAKEKGRETPRTK
jgi:hypothetical protein